MSSRDSLQRLPSYTKRLLLTPPFFSCRPQCVVGSSVAVLASRDPIPRGQRERINEQLSGASSTTSSVEFHGRATQWTAAMAVEARDWGRAGAWLFQRRVVLMP
jgi:hypothetical protein